MNTVCKVHLQGKIFLPFVDIDIPNITVKEIHKIAK